MYYSMVMLAVIMFGLQFFLNEEYQKNFGSGKKATMLFIAIGNFFGFVILLLINGFSFGSTWFTLVMAIVNAVNTILCSVCSLKALDKINLSRFSLFCMLGGMVLPFFAGILFFNETLTLGMIICIATVFVAMLLTLEKSDTKGGMIYYIGIFVFNGMAGVLSKMFQALSFEKATAADYTILTTAITTIIAIVIYVLNRSSDFKILNFKKLMVCCFGNGVLNRLANYLLLLALVHLPASVQYPMVTGGVMIVSTLLAYVTPKKPSKRELIALVLSFIGILALIMF